MLHYLTKSIVYLITKEPYFAYPYLRVLNLSNIKRTKFDTALSTAINEGRFSEIANVATNSFNLDESTKWLDRPAFVIISFAFL